MYIIFEINIVFFKVRILPIYLCIYSGTCLNGSWIGEKLLLLIIRKGCRHFFIERRLLTRIIKLFHLRFFPYFYEKLIIPLKHSFFSKIFLAEFVDYRSCHICYIFFKFQRRSSTQHHVNYICLCAHFRFFQFEMWNPGLYKILRRNMISIRKVSRCTRTFLGVIDFSGQTIPQDLGLNVATRLPLGLFSLING